MNKELAIDIKVDHVDIAMLEDHQLVEFHEESLKQRFAVGNIYIGRVRKIMAGLNAAFVDVGCDKEAFLHYNDLGEQFLTVNHYVQQILNDRRHEPTFKRFPDLEKEGSIQSVLTVGQMILVQVMKEPISTKGPRLTGEISIAGRNMVLLPLAQSRTSLSQKIKGGEERSRLRQLVASIKPEHCGVIVRTVADGKFVAELDAEMTSLQRKWEEVLSGIRSSRGISLVLEELNRSIATLRDLFDPEFEAIHVNDREAYEELTGYVKSIAPDKVDIVKFYNDDLPIFDHFAITKQVKSLFGRVVSMKRGAYLVMDQTEAMFVVDVNSGTRTKSTQGQEENALEVNIMAAEEIARQLRLRDIGGIVIIDFIDMDVKANNQKLFDTMNQCMKSDRARHTILPITKFGLMQITRQRVRPATIVNTQETCPTCFGTGKAQPSILFTDQLEEKLDFLVNTLGMRDVTLCVHPFVEAFITKGLWSLKRQWQRRYTRKFRLLSMQELGFLQFKFVDAQGNEISTTPTDYED